MLSAGYGGGAFSFSFCAGRRRSRRRNQRSRIPCCRLRRRAKRSGSCRSCCRKARWIWVGSIRCARIRRIDWKVRCFCPRERCGRSRLGLRKSSCSAAGVHSFHTRCAAPPAAQKARRPDRIVRKKNHSVPRRRTRHRKPTRLRVGSCGSVLFRDIRDNDRCPCGPPLRNRVQYALSPDLNLNHYSIQAGAFCCYIVNSSPFCHKIW